MRNLRQHVLPLTEAGSTSKKWGNVPIPASASAWSRPERRGIPGQLRMAALLVSLVLMPLANALILPRRLEMERDFPGLYPARASPEDSPLCQDVHPELRVPCRCSFIHSRRAGEEHVTVEVAMDCDRVVFAGEIPALPFRAPIVSFSQRWVGHQALPTQPFTTAELPLRKLDLSGNNLQRLTDRLLGDHLAGHLQELVLADNLFGDNLNPIFSTSEFHGLRELRLLDLSGNQIKGLEEGILEGCDNLQELRLDRNSLNGIPSHTLHGPRALKTLIITRNRIGTVPAGALTGQPQIEHLDLSHNIIKSVDGGALAGLGHLRELYLKHNRLSKLNSDVFEGAPNLEVLDLSQNFLRELPSFAFKDLTKLVHLNLSANLIERLDNEGLRIQGLLQSLDLSSNNIGNIAPGTFRGLRHLKVLDLSVNSLRTVEDDAFEGLDGLESLRLRDNNILALPASALGRLPRLRSLSLDYNRLAVISADLLRTVSERAFELGLSRNVIRELPPAAFRDFTRLRKLDLGGNLLLTIDSSSFNGLEDILEELNLSENKLSSITGSPLMLKNLRSLDLSGNLVRNLGTGVLSSLVSLERLDVSQNPQLSLGQRALHSLVKLRWLDLSRAGIRSLSSDLLKKCADLEYISLQGNALHDLPEGIFDNLSNVTTVDISNNQLSNIRSGIFAGMTLLRKLNLSSNRLQAFKGELLDATDTASALQELDLSNNQLGYLFPGSLRAHSRLRALRLQNNKLTFFPSELLAGLRYLEEVNLSGNLLKAVDDMDFARLPCLRELDLSDNQLEVVSETAFHNSTQLQVLRIARNRLDRLAERTFEGLSRVELLDLQSNLLGELPESLFERSRLHMLENINLANNSFQMAPLSTLQRQYFFLSSVDLSGNQITEIPADDTIMVNIKRLDLSFNPLSQQAINNVLAEPKTVRQLIMSGTGIVQLSVLETPFLRSLNLSHNNITQLRPEMVARPTLLEELDLSHNQLAEWPRVWQQLKHLQALDISHNAISSVVQGDLDGLSGLRRLRLDSLPQLSRFERSAFSGLSALSELRAAGFPRLGYLDAAGLLRSLGTLSILHLEFKDATISGDTLSPVLQPRLRELGVHGSRVRALSSGVLAGLKAPRVRVLLTETALTALPPALLFPLPRSSRVDVDVSSSQLTSLPPQLLATLDDRRGHLTVQGLASNPLQCDCAARALRRWLPGSGMGDIRCHGPPALAGRLLVEVGDDDLTCDPHRAPTTSTSTSTNAPIITAVGPKVSRPYLRDTTEPDIIWSLPPPPSTARPNTAVTTARTTLGSAVISNDDTLIIGIVGGVAAFVAILIIVICTVRLRFGGSQYHGAPAVMNPHAVMAPGCTCMPTCASAGPGSPAASLYISPGYAATLPPKMRGMPLPTGPPSIAPSPLRTSYASLGRPPPPHTPTSYHHQQHPYYITYSGEEKDLR